MSDSTCVYWLVDLLLLLAVILCLQSLNPKFEAPLSRLLSHLSQNIQSEEKQCQWSLQKQTDEDGEVVLATIKTQLSGLPFVWEFHLRKAAEKEVMVTLGF